MKDTHKVNLKCVICKEKLMGFGNNAEPVRKGICCDDCNREMVIPVRLISLWENRK
jgi:hypothetical protein